MRTERQKSGGAISGLALASCLVLMLRVGCGGRPSVVLRDAPPLDLPGVTVPEVNQVAGIDCNNPVHWDGETMYVFSSTAQPYRSSGPDLAGLRRPSEPTVFDNDGNWKGGRWLESTCQDEQTGLLYGWYHHEQVGICPQREKTVTAPQIGAAVSDDNGLHWRDLGIILRSPPEAMRCDTTNDAFAGGNGDFCVIADEAKEYLYFYFDSYHTDVRQQGVCAARMRYADRDAPVGKVFKYHAGAWVAPGIDGPVTPFIWTTTDWHCPQANSFWGPAIHWNTHLKRYVMLLNRARNDKWDPEGMYVSFNRDLARPPDWSEPEKILDVADFRGSRYYPQVIGLDVARHETDRLAGRVARFFITGKSSWEIVFLNPGESIDRASRP